MSASLMQPALFPPPPAVVPGEIEAHAVSLPARTFTGDFWFTHRAADRLWFSLGDVAGKGLPAALIMAMIQEELEHQIASCARRGCDPAATMDRLHTLLRPILPGNRFATAVIGWLADDGTLRIANGGHCPPLIVRADGTIEEIGSTGPAVAILPTARWRSTTTTLAPGELLVLYSDGVIESRSPDGSEFGTAGLTRLLGSGNCCPRRAASAIVRAVDRHTGGIREDDLTVLVIRAGGGATAR